MTSFQGTVLITGASGYIGSHTLVELLNVGYDVICIDNLTNSRSGSLRRVEHITKKKVTFYHCDLLDSSVVQAIFDKHNIDFVIHFAAMKGVGESMSFPLMYYKNNFIGTINLVEAMKDHNVYNLVFSSSCTVYGDPEHLPITEDHPAGNITNVYGRTKFLIEEMLKDLSYAEPRWSIIALRYFNPVGAHPSGSLGEDPTKDFSNLMPYIGQVALGRKTYLSVFGNDYDTPDGTAIRDYIHVMDLASGHVRALARFRNERARYKTYNLGTGRGVSVIELARAFEEVTKVKIPLEFLPRREGDIVAMFANAELAKKEMDWEAKYSLENMCEDFWRWQTMNPDGYAKEEDYPPATLDLNKPLSEQKTEEKVSSKGLKEAAANGVCNEVGGSNGVATRNTS